METSDQEIVESFLLSPRLPHIVVELLLKYLDVLALKTLRLVCKITKSWVETPDVLRRFVVRITGKFLLDELLGAPDPVPWNAFVIIEGYKSFHDNDVQSFLAAYGELVRELKFNWNSRRDVLHVGLCNCGDCGVVMRSQSKLLFGCPKLHYEFHWDDNRLEALKNLRHFHVEIFNGDDNQGLDPMKFFSRLLATCTHLKTLRVPMFKMDNASLSDYHYAYSFHNGESYEQFVVTPLLDTIAKGHLRSVAAPYCDDKQLLRLALACRETDTVLHCGWIDNRRSERSFLQNLALEHVSVLDIIGDLTAITDTIIDQPLTSVRSMHFFLESFRGFDNCGYTMPSFPHLTTVDFRFCNDNEAEDRKNVEVEAMERFAHRLAQVKRPSVKTLCVGYDEDAAEFSKNISPVALCTSFVNLRELSVIKWEGEDEEWLKLWPLVGQILVELVLNECPNLTDRGVLGDDLKNPAFLQLKHLRKLKYWRHVNVSPGKGNVTERSIIHSFRHMRLRTLEFFVGTSLFSAEFPSVSVKTVKAMEKGVIVETVEHCMVQARDLLPSNYSWREGRIKLRKESVTDFREWDISSYYSPLKNCYTCCSIT